MTLERIQKLINQFNTSLDSAIFPKPSFDLKDMQYFGTDKNITLFATVKFSPTDRRSLWKMTRFSLFVWQRVKEHKDMVASLKKTTYKNKNIEYNV